MSVTENNLYESRKIEEFLDFTRNQKMLAIIMVLYGHDLIPCEEIRKKLYAKYSIFSVNEKGVEKLQREGSVEKLAEADEYRLTSFSKILRLYPKEREIS